MKEKQKRLSILSNLEEFAFYGTPDFDNAQRRQYFAFEPQERNLIEGCSSLHAKVYCALQIGYFKAKNTFFKFSLHAISQPDVNFILARYFNGQTLSAFMITKYEHYFQRREICRLFGYRLWSNDFLPETYDRAKTIVRRDISPNFISNELLSFFKNQNIVRPGYTTLQDVVSVVLTQERNRLKLKLQELFLTSAYLRVCLS